MCGHNCALSLRRFLSFLPLRNPTTHTVILPGKDSEATSQSDKYRDDSLGGRSFKNITCFSNKQAIINLEADRRLDVLVRVAWGPSCYPTELQCGKGFWFCQSLLPPWPWTSCAASLSLNFLIQKLWNMELISRTLRIQSEIEGINSVPGTLWASNKLWLKDYQSKDYQSKGTKLTLVHRCLSLISGCSPSNQIITNNLCAKHCSHHYHLPSINMFTVVAP